MNTQKSNTPDPNRPQPKPLLKIALDVHLSWHVMAVQEEGTNPKPPQRFKPADFLKWIQQKRAVGYNIITCYEAGPFGYGLHRQLTALGVTNYVIRPRNWDDQHTRIKTDRTDALSMLNALDRFVAGNQKALALVRVPTEAQERQRTQSRLRAATPAGACDQVWQPTLTLGAGGDGLAINPLSTRVSANQEVENEINGPIHDRGSAQASAGGVGARLRRRLVAHLHRTNHAGETRSENGGLKNMIKKLFAR